MTPMERAARALAEAMGDDFDHAFASKAEWINARGDKGGRFRDVNEPRQVDYIEGVRAVLQAIREPSEGVVEAGIAKVDECTDNWTASAACAAGHAYQAMIDTALTE